MLALDHRGSFKRLISPENPDEVDKNKAKEIKAKLISTLYDKISGLLIDQEYGYPAYKNMEENFKPYLLPAEKSGYENKEGERITQLEYDAKQIKEMGASGVKLLIYFNPTAQTSNLQIETATKILEDAKDLNLPFFLEVVTYNHAPDEYLIVDSLKMLLNKKIYPDVYKLEYPGSLENCLKTTELLEDIPWILLTKGDNFSGFYNHLENAVNAGCKGFLAGRSLWQEIPSIKNENEMQEILEQTVIPRFEKISEIVLLSWKSSPGM